MIDPIIMQAVDPNPSLPVVKPIGRRATLGRRQVLTYLLLGGILTLALLLRVWALNYDLPYMHHPDEPGYIVLSQTIFKTGDLNPRFFAYPTLMFYLNALAHVPYYLAGRALGIFDSSSDIIAPTSLVMGSTFAPMPSAVLLGRGVTVLVGVGAVLLVYLIGRKLSGERAVGLTAALLLAISPTHIYHSRVVTPDAFVTFFALSAFLMSVYVFREGKTWPYVAAGIAIGLTTSSKYNGALIAVTLPVAHLLRMGWSGWRDYRLYLAALISLVTFFVVTPYALLDYRPFIGGMRAEARHYMTGHAGMEGDTVRWYLTFLWTSMGLTAVLAAAQIIRGVATRSRPILLLSVFPVTYFLFISRFVVRNDRTILPILPFLFLLAAWLLIDAAKLARRIPSPAVRRASAVGLGLVLLIALALPARQTIDFVRQLNAPQVRESAALWIADNLPTGSHIALESYSPYLDPGQYSILPLNKLIDHPPQWYVDQGYDYLIFSSGLYGRFFIEPDRYADEVARYNEFFGRFQLAQRFHSGRLEILVYRVTP